MSRIKERFFAGGDLQRYLVLINPNVPNKTKKLPGMALLVARNTEH